MGKDMEFLLEKACYCEADGIVPSYIVPYVKDDKVAGTKIMDIGAYASKLGEAGLLKDIRR